MNVFTPEFATHWRRQTGLTGVMVEFVVWMTVITAALRGLAYLLMGVAWLLERTL